MVKAGTRRTEGTVATGYSARVWPPGSGWNAAHVERAARLAHHSAPFRADHAVQFHRIERVQAGAIDNESAALGTREKGKALVGPAVDGVAGLLRQMIAGEAINLPTVTFYPEGKRDLVSGDPI